MLYFVFLNILPETEAFKPLLELVCICDLHMYTINRNAIIVMFI